MPAIPRALYVPLRSALMDTDEFNNPAQLAALFRTTEGLYPFRNGLPGANALDARVDITVAYTLEKRLITGENALVVLLRSLSQNYDPMDERHVRLSTLADQLEFALTRPPRPTQQTLEANPEQARMLWTADIEAMLRAARSVARIAVPRIRGGTEIGRDTGTAWMITPRLALTAWHVISTNSSRYDPPVEQDDLDDQVANALLTFDFTVHANGIQYKVEKLEHPTIDTQTLDFAVLRLKDRSDTSLAGRGFLRLDLDSALTSQTMLYVIQHPLGQPQQISGDVFARLGTGPGSILYQAPTEPGTSGAPVCNRDTWAAVAVHSGEDEVAHLREGLLIKTMMEHLQQQRPDLYQEIMTVQQRQQ